jgi:hypothetical protein
MSHGVRSGLMQPTNGKALPILERSFGPTRCSRPESQLDAGKSIENLSSEGIPNGSRMSMTPLRRALLSGFTLFGGHFVNRRLDRAGLIGVLIMVAVVGIVGVARAVPFDNSGLRILVWLPMGLLALVGLIALLSARLTFHDAPQAAQRPPTLAIRVIRLPVTLVGAALVAAAGIASVPYLGGMHLRSTAQPVGAIEFGSSPFIGGYGTLFDALLDAPRGSERLRGRISLQGCSGTHARFGVPAATG